jgi:hypothetical protein
MAAPHVAGGAALILGATPSATPAAVWSAMSAASTPNKITSPGTGSPNRLLRVPGGTSGPPVVANPGNRTGTVGVATSLQMSATGGTPPYTWSASGLPAGLTINPSSGLISGTPTTAATYNVTVTATGGGSGSTSFQWVISAPGGPVVTNPGNRTGTVGVATSLQMSATGGTPPYTWSATGLPAGLTINASSGLISGTPTTAATYNVTVTATGGGSGSTSFQWVISPPSGSCTSPGQKMVNPGFESGATGWAGQTGSIYTWTGIGAPRTGVRSAWLSGYGYTSTESIQQTVTIPAGCTNSVLSFYLKIVTSEYEPAVFDRFTVQIGATTLATYTNLNPSGYLLRSFNVGAYAGQTVVIKFTGTEDWSYQTSFVVDDTSLVAG